MVYKGSCHCGAVSFEVETQGQLEVEDCNCSICSMSGFLHLIVPKNQFRLLAGNDLLETYTFNTGVAQHTFCKRCGIKSFYIPRSNPDGIDVNARCLDVSLKNMTVVKFDGRHWEKNAHALTHKSQS